MVENEETPGAKTKRQMKFWGNISLYSLVLTFLGALMHLVVVPLSVALSAPRLYVVLAITHALVVGTLFVSVGRVIYLFFYGPTDRVV